MLVHRLGHVVDGLFDQALSLLHSLARLVDELRLNLIQSLPELVHLRPEIHLLGMRLLFRPPLKARAVHLDGLGAAHDLGVRPHLLGLGAVVSRLRRLPHWRVPPNTPPSITPALL